MCEPQQDADRLVKVMPSLPLTQKCSLGDRWYLIYSQISRTLNNLILKSMSLRYKLELATDSLREGTSCGMDIATRLQVVLRRREARKTLKFTGKHIVSTLTGDLLVAGNVFGSLDMAAETLHVQQVPSLLKGIPETSWTVKLPSGHETSSNNKVAIEPSQDLLVLSQIDWLVSAASTDFNDHIDI